MTASVMAVFCSADRPVVPMMRLTPAAAAAGALTAVAAAMVKSMRTSVLDSFRTEARSLESETGTSIFPMPATSPMSFPMLTISKAAETVMPSVAMRWRTIMVPILPQAPTRAALTSVIRRPPGRSMRSRISRKRNICTLLSECNPEHGI